MNFNHLHIFQKVAEKEHFTRAAEELFISQPAVSKQIHELERALQQPLFTRVGQKVHLTEAGKLLYEYSKRIFALSDEAEQALMDMNDLLRGRLAVGASTTIGTYLLPELLGEYKSRYPHIELSVWIANTEEVQDAVRSRRLELGIVEGEIISTDLDHFDWLPDELVFIAPNSCPLPEQRAMTVRDVLDLPLSLIMREKGSGTREVLERAFIEHGMEPPMPIMELGSTEAIKRAVRANLGWSFVSKNTIQLEVKAGLLRTVPIADFRVLRMLSIISPKEKRISKAAQAFLSLISHNV
ncbi:MAG TPA: LysR family transcriptional regulator [Dictyobacter sp.]|jgi:DNA-binding transcriptional LysR family regulator|nr:LysR family transcriptional regulator [Dictyobacter sp.]